MELLEDGLDIPEVVDDIGEDDYIKFVIDGQMVGVGQQEVHLGMSAASVLERLGGEIDAHTEGRLDCGEQISSTATDFEDPLASYHQVSIDFGEAFVVITTQAMPTAGPAGQSIPVCNSL